MPAPASPRVAIGSTNPVKVDAVARVVRHWDPGATVIPVSVVSGVPDQPWGDAQTIEGASNRARAARLAAGADFGVGIEGGVVESPDGALRTCAWAAVALPGGACSVGGSLSMPLPAAIADLVRRGSELGHAVDSLVGSENTRQQAGAVGVLTAGLVDRARAYETLVAYAFAPLLSPRFWSTPQVPRVTAGRT